MSKTTDALRARGIYSDAVFFWDQPYYCWRASFARSPIPSCYAVYKRGENLGTAWSDHGARTFTGFASALWTPGMSKRQAAEAEARAFMAERFGITTFARCPFGGVGDAAFVKRRLKELLALPVKHRTPEPT